MKRIALVFSIFAIAAMVAGWTPKAWAFSGPVTQCVGCHPGFAGGSGSDGHAAHLSLGLACGACHEGAFNVSGTNSALCAQCHVVPGLPNHHDNAGAASCVTCHPGTPAPENTPPPGYAAVGLDPCDGSEEVWLNSLTVSLDNDGDLLYDGDDPDCGPPPECTCDDDVFCADCDDDVFCTFDTCDTANGICINTPTRICEDLEFCNGAETCDPVNDCQPGTPPCDPETETCNEVTDTCDPIVTGCTSDAECDNNNVCDGTETCDTATGNCVDGTPLVCDDGDACNGAESCDAMNGCQAGTPLVCDDGMFCNGVETCDSATGCVDAMAPCAANGTCDEVNDVCVSGCTDDAQCDDGMFCNGAETCNVATGECMDGMAPCAAGETCDEATDTCTAPPKDDVMYSPDSPLGMAHISMYENVGTVCTDCHNGEFLPAAPNIAKMEKVTMGGKKACVRCHNGGKKAPLLFISLMNTLEPAYGRCGDCHGVKIVKPRKTKSSQGR